MKKNLALTLCAFFIFTIFASLAVAKTVDKNPFANYNVQVQLRPSESAEQVNDLFSSSAIDTFILGEWDFDTLTGCSMEGWITNDNTLQLDLYWHVIEDTNTACLPSQAMWCGAEPSSAVPYCAWADAPGYGNGWEQYLTTEAFAFTGTVNWAFRIAWDTETGFDFVTLQYDSAGSWIDFLVLDGQSGDSVACYEEMAVSILPVGLSRTKLRFEFTSDTGFSDEDGFDTSEWGAVAVDNVSVEDDIGAVVEFEDFEDEALDDRVATESDTTWYAGVPDPIGDFTGVDIGLFEEDPCRDNITCQLFFYENSTLTDPLYPGTFVVPRDVDLEAVSPKMDWDMGGSIPSTAARTQYTFQVYRDLPLGGSVFYIWGIRTYTTSDPTCPGVWRDRNFVYYGPDKDFLYGGDTVTDLIDPGPDAVQVRVGVVDLCDPFCVDYGFPGEPHTPSPTFDNIEVRRLGVTGPAWSHRDLDFFQDNFPEDGSTTGIGRIDMANDVNPQANPVIHPGDSLALSASAPAEGGLAANPTMYVKVVQGPHAGLANSTIQGTYGTWTGVVSGWNAIVLDSARTSGGNTVEDVWAGDLNDSLFVAGDVIHYFFEATTDSGNTGIYARGVENAGIDDTAGGAFFEVSILPVGNGDILFVDDFHLRGSQNYFRSAFNQAGYPYDEYDVGSASSLVGNGPGGRVKALAQVQVYNKIVWNSGDLDIGTISDGVADKGTDAQLLRDYLDLTPHDVGLWVSGDDVAFDLDQSETAAAIDLLNNWMGVSFIQQSQHDLTGIAAPVITAEPGSPWAGAVACSTHVAYGGCLVINKFDVLETNAGSSYGFTWPGHNPAGNDPRGAVIYNSQLNSTGSAANTVWQAYSFHFMRDDVPGPRQDRVCFMDVTLQYLGNTPGPPTSAGDLPKTYSLAQNKPNPFNPTTEIKFDLPKSGHVSLKVYNVAGQLVKTLVNDYREAKVHSVVWDGTNDSGRKVTSGVYFYSITSGDFKDHKKMVLLK
jgi:hypothetical protein